MPLLSNVDARDQIPYNYFSNVQIVKNNEIYKYFVIKKTIIPISQNKWVEYNPFLNMLIGKKYIVNLCFKIAKDRYIQTQCSTNF